MTFNEYWQKQKETGWPELRAFKKELLERLDLNGEANLRRKKRENDFSILERKEIVCIINERENTNTDINTLFPEPKKTKQVA